MPEGIFLKDLFIKHFIAKAFHWTPDVLERISADELDALVYIEGLINKKEKEDMDKATRKSQQGMR
jgi:hypothetical protein